MIKDVEKGHFSKKGLAEFSADLSWCEGKLKGLNKKNKGSLVVEKDSNTKFEVRATEKSGYHSCHEAKKAASAAE